MARKRTGLRNRYRSGRSTYCAQDKAKSRDRYGKYMNGKCLDSDVIAGRTLRAVQ
jgi:hypothetical protein